MFDDIPERTLLWQLARRLPDILAHRAPVGFEAEFDNRAGAHTLYRGMLLPFAREGQDGIGFVYGVISWKMLADAELSADIVTAVDGALATAPLPSLVQVWGDSTIASRSRPTEIRDQSTMPLDAQLATARMVARRVRRRMRSRGRGDPPRLGPCL